MPIPITRRTFPRFRLVPLLALGACMGWCDIDLFGVTLRPIAGEFGLRAWEDGRYYLERTSFAQGGESVDRLGWRGGTIVVRRRTVEANLGHEWSVIDAATRDVRDRLTAAQIAADPIAGSIPTYSADSAWARLRR